MIQLLVFLALTMGSVESAHSDTLRQACEASYKTWLETYGGSDPFGAIGKASPWKVDPAVLRQVIRDTQHLDISTLPPAQLFDGDVPVSPAEAFGLAAGSAKPIEERDLDIRQNMMDFLARKQLESGVLSIAYVGIAHAIDLFLARPDIRATYLMKPFDMFSKNRSPGFLQFAKLLGLSIPPTFQEVSAGFYGLPYVYAYESARNVNLKDLPEQAFQTLQTNSQVLVLGEYHDVDSVEWLNGFPTFECLKAMEIHRIDIGFEGRRKGIPFTLQGQLFRREMLEQMELRAQKLNLTFDQLIERLPPEAAELIRQKSVIDNTAAHRFLQILQGYERLGMIIGLEGLESPDYDENGK